MIYNCMSTQCICFMKNRRSWLTDDYGTFCLNCGGPVRCELHEADEVAPGDASEIGNVTNLQLGTKRRDSVAFGGASEGLDSNLLR